MRSVARPTLPAAIAHPHQPPLATIPMAHPLFRREILHLHMGDLPHGSWPPALERLPPAAASSDDADAAGGTR
jgi:hypothetical protein